MKLKKIKSIHILSLLALLPSRVLATGGYGLETARSTSGLPSGDIPTYLGRFAGAALALSGSIFLFLIVYGGIIMMTAAGNQSNIDKGKKIITWAIIGALILGAAYAITRLVFQVFQ
jgi:hypothetical protein